MDIKELYAIYKAHPVITTDSREVPEGSIFFALKGESFDGNKYATAALEKGASFAVIDDAEVFNNAEIAESAGEKSLILVDDVLQTFKDLAREHRRQFDIPVVGITGTNGKTTTKELLATVLSEKYNVLFTQGHFNNDVGVPKTLFRLKPEHEIAVV
ncbi:MAG: UDP-N-acetylmuramoyl-tripeptide--D-alanyl-D-alanine ligase, partial [Muribaculaceae bacterium]|nr:UDP-N-acetylmuramoyl-tripeptide--D-alanyl-D-alanine ligase [Muribaculaceae bacterium]